MKRLSLITSIALVLLLTVSTSFAQKRKKNEEPPKVEAPTFKISEKTKKAVYNEVVQQKGTVGATYDKVFAWANKFYKAPSNVLRKKERDNGLLVAKGRFYLNYTEPETGTKKRAHTMEYDLTFNFKEDRYRYEITNIIYKSTSYQGIEQWIDANTTTYNHKTASYLVTLDEELRKIIDSFKTSIASVEKAEEEW
ncbi:MAG: DUF4468 domain-containing protein [Flavobacteriales bacterium]|nr:DUF4468 domain-containing protein [Flavobacteriales bacterium]